MLEQHGLENEEDGELHDKLLDCELFEGEGEEKLLHFVFDEQLKLLQLVELQLKLEHTLLMEQHGLSKEEDSELLEELLD